MKPTIQGTKTLAECIRQNYVVLRGRCSQVHDEYFRYCRQEKTTFIRVLPRNKFCTVGEPEMPGCSFHYDLTATKEIALLKSQAGFSFEKVPVDKLDWFVKELFRICTANHSRSIGAA